MEFGDMIDSRDILERVEDLKDLFADHTPFRTDGEIEFWVDDDDGTETDLFEEYEELEALNEFVEEAESYSSDFHHGESVISEDYFTEYAEDMAKDIYVIEEHWPYTAIDWCQAAEQLKQDYCSIAYDGEMYWIRSN